jgi:hypothetical protein
MFGQNLARCYHCGKQWVVGDCIPGICPECIRKGHSREGRCWECERRQFEEDFKNDPDLVQETLVDDDGELSVKKEPYFDGEDGWT